MKVIACGNNQQKQIYTSINKLIKLKNFCGLVYTQSMVGYLANKALFQDSEAKSSEFCEEKKKIQDMSFTSYATLEDDLTCSYVIHHPV